MMRLFKNFLAGLAFAAGITVMALGVNYAPAASLSLFTGPGGTNPTTEMPPGIGTLNQLIGSLNSSIAQWLTLNNSTAEAGEVALSSSSSFAAKSNCGTLASSAECIVVVDETGRVGFIPVY